MSRIRNTAANELLKRKHSAQARTPGGDDYLFKKGLGHEKDFKTFDKSQKLKDPDLNKCCGRFLKFSETPPIYVKKN
jgi:hypothetical protein